MTRRTLHAFLFTSVAVALNHTAPGSLRAQTPGPVPRRSCCPPPTAPLQPPPQTPPTEPGKEPAAAQTPPGQPNQPTNFDGTDLSERSGAVGGDSVAVSTPQIIGDLGFASGPGGGGNGGGGGANSGPGGGGNGGGGNGGGGNSGRGPGRNGRGSSSDRVGVSPTGTADSFTVPEASGSASLFRGAFKITEDESPRPVDRVFGTYNYFHNVGKVFNPPGQGPLDVHRELIGFEKTFLDRNASVEMRLPFLELGGTADDQGVGDLSAILKYAVLNDRQTGNVVSLGFSVTAPTSKFTSTSAAGEDVHATLLQPFVGSIWNRDAFFVQGFSGVIVPTDSRDVTIMLNDVCAGYRLYSASPAQGRFVTGVTPVFETHINTPLNHRGAFAQPVGLSDIVILTSGLHVDMGRTTLTFGAATPVTGPKPFDVEADVQLNFRF